MPRLARLLPALLWCAALPAAAQLLSPGKLARGHAELEGLGSCTRCHASGDQVSADRCLDCHDKLAARIRAGEGYHARVSGTCVDCHSDHRGLDYELVRWNRDAFAHDSTGYALEGRHAAAKCDACHRDPKTYLGLDPACLACHADQHRGQLGTDCRSCHDLAAWKPAPFDHGRARFHLEGRHVQVACDRCHQQALDDTSAAYTRYREIPFAACRDCHADYHRGQFHEDCAACHTVAGWKPVPVDHGRTRFPLTGKHTTVACAACHGPRAEEGQGAIARFRGLPFAACRDCHADYHQGQFTEDCARCHSVSGWKLAGFDHDRTRFPLVGRHVAVACERCHFKEQSGEGTTFTRLRGLDFASCRDCHADRHAGQFDGDCAGCHAVMGWKPSSFEHARAAFPLDGAHRDVPCQACHRLFVAADGTETARYRPVPGNCAACHG